MEILNKNIRERVEVGRIDLMKRFSFFEVKEADATAVINALDGASWKGYRLGVEIAGAEGGEASGQKDSGHKGARKPAPKKSSAGRRESLTREKSSRGSSSREEHRRGGYPEENSGRKSRSRKDDWKQFFNNDGWDRDLSSKGGKKSKKRK